jgi:hypothetical protein
MVSFYQQLSDEARKETHRRLLEETEAVVQTALVIGAIALATWVGLFATAGQAPVSTLNHSISGLMLAGGSILITSPILFRVRGRYLTFLGRCAGLYLGLTALGLALALVASDLLHGWPGDVLAIFGLGTLVGRDLLDSFEELLMQARIATGPAAPAATAEAQSAACRGASSGNNIPDNQS